MQPYNYRDMNDYYNNSSSNPNANAPNFNSVNEMNKPMNSPFPMNNSGNGDLQNINEIPHDNMQNQNFYYQNQQMHMQQGMMPPSMTQQIPQHIPPSMSQNVPQNMSPPPPPLTHAHQGYASSTVSQPFQTNMQQPYASTQVPPAFQQNLNYTDPMQMNQSLHSNADGYINRTSYGMPNNSHPNLMTNKGVTAPNLVSYDTSGSMVNMQTSPTECFEELLQFNAFPHFVKSSVSFMPANSSLKQKAHVPLGFIVQPLAPIPDGYPELASVNFGNSTIVRCKKCRTYINPFVKFDCGGKKWNCNMCYNVNDTPQFYYVPVDEKGKRKDLFQRPELCTGSVEFIAPSDYMIRAPQPPVYLFVIDVTVNAVNSGLLDIVCNTIRKVLPKNADLNNKQSFDSRALIGIITFDSTVHFYNLNSNLKQTQMMVVSDLTEIFLPIPEDILVNVQESQNTIDILLDNLPTMWRNSKTIDCCAGSAIKAATLVLKKIGGKMILFLSSIPNIGDLTVNTSRESKSSSKSKYKNIYVSNSTQDSNIMDSKLKEVELLNPLNNSYVELAQSITQFQIAVDLFACPMQPTGLDLATIYPLVKNSGGSLYYYPQFNVQQYSDKLREELLFTLTTETAWESVMRIRISRGWKITNWYGNFQFRGVDLLALPNCHSSQSFSILVDLEENVVQDSTVYVQSALLYTNSNGERRIRLHTFALPVTQNIKSITDSIHPQVVVSLLSHQAIEISKKGKIADGRNLIQTLCSQVLSSQVSPSENSRLLSVYILGMLKSIAFRDSGDVPSDLRIFHWSRIENIPVASREAYFYPRMFSLHNLQNHHGACDENNAIILPDSLNLTCDNMTQDGAYLLEDGETITMWIGRGIDPEWVHAVFGVQSLDQLITDYAENHIGSTGNPYGIQILNIINAIRKSRNPPYMRLLVVKQGDPLEHKFFASLIEDRSQYMMLSLKEFLTKICPKFPQFTTPLNNPHVLTHGR